MKYHFFLLTLTIIVLSNCQKKAASQETVISYDRIEFLRKKLKEPSDSSIIAVAHRAAWTDSIPENTLEAIQRAVDLGVDIVEIDIRLTKDKKLILWHDKGLDQDSNGSGKVSDRTWDEIKDLKIKNSKGDYTDFKIPALKEALLLMKGKVLIYLDKTLKYRELVEQLLEETETKSQAIFYGNDPIEDSSNNRFLTDYLFIPALEEGDPDQKVIIKNYLDKTNTTGFIIRFSSEDSPFINQIPYIRSLGSNVWVGTMSSSQGGGHWDSLAVLDPESHWGWHISKGVNILCTNQAESLMKYLREKKLHK